jgi:hypothetical protein
MLGSLLALALLQGTPAAAPCSNLDACLQSMQVEARRVEAGTYPDSCDAFRTRLTVFDGEAKARLLALALSADPRVQNMAGCVLGGWPTWTSGELPALERAVAAEDDGGWIVRAMVHFPARDAVPVLGGIVAKGGWSNQAGFALAQMMPGALSDFLRFAASKPPSESGNLVWGPLGEFATDQGRLDEMVKALAAAANDQKRASAERVLALRMLATARMRGRVAGPSIRALRGAPDPSIRRAVHVALMSMRDPSLVDEVAASCPPLGSETVDSSFRGGLPPPPADPYAYVSGVAPACLEILADMGPAAGRVAPTLLPYLQSSSWRWRTQAALTLGKLGNPAAASKLRPLLADKDWQVVAAAILAEAQLHDGDAISTIEDLSRKHWLYSVRQAASAAVPVLQSGDTAALERLYEPAMTPGLLLSDPLPVPAKACPLDAGSPLPMQLTLAGGELRGTDHGEFGGGLVWQRAGRPPVKLLEFNVSGLFKVSPHSVWVVTGLAHMDLNTAQLYRVDIGADGNPRLDLLITLPGWAWQRAEAHGELQLQGREGSFALKPGDSEGQTAVIREMRCMN